MRRPFVVFLLAIVILPAGRVPAQNMSVQQGYLKSGIAKEFHEPDRSTLLAFLAECRKVSDSAAKALFEHDFAKVSKAVSPEAAKAWRAVADDLREFRRQNPGATLQYRNQALEFVGTEGASTSRVWYALLPAVPAEARNFIAIVVELTPDGYRVIAIQPLGYAEAVPTWLQQVDAPVAPPE